MDALQAQIEVIKGLGVLGLLVLVIIGRLRGWWVEGGTHKKLEQQWEERFQDKEAECKEYREENRTLWQEKVLDARKAGDIAEAYIEIWEREHGKRSP